MEDNNNAQKINMKTLLLHVVNNLIIDCEHIKLLLSKPKESKYIPDFLKDMQIRYVQFSTIIPNIFEIEWEYYDNLTEEHIIFPIPIIAIKLNVIILHIRLWERKGNV